MKFIALALMLTAGHAMADVPVITAKNVSCNTLKTRIQTYGTVTVVKKILGFKKRYTVHQSEACGSDERKVRGVFKTKDVKKCVAGEWCEYDPPYVYSGSYDSGSSGSTWDSGSSWSSGSSSSGSSSSGSNYNPPSSDTRGPRYCPGC